MRWPAAVVVLPGDATGALTREWVYTAFGRGERHLSVVHGAEDALPRAVASVTAPERTTRLRTLLTQSAGQAAAAAEAGTASGAAQEREDGSLTGAARPARPSRPERPGGERLPDAPRPSSQSAPLGPLGEHPPPDFALSPRRPAQVALVEDGADVEAADHPLRVRLLERRSQPLARLARLVRRRDPQRGVALVQPELLVPGGDLVRPRTPRRGRRARRARCCPRTSPWSSSSAESGSRSVTRCACASSRCGSTTV